MRLHISEMTFFQDKRAEILKETAAEKQRGRAWETKLRQAASEARELRKALDEEELICKERMDALEKRQRDSEGSGLQAAIASIASIARASVSMSQSSQSVRESALKLGHLGSSACSRQEKLKQELHTAEDLRFEISSQVSEMRAELERLHRASDVEGGVSDLIVQPAAAQLRQWKLQQERKASLRLQGMVKRFGAKAGGSASSLAVSESESEGNDDGGALPSREPGELGEREPGDAGLSGRIESTQAFLRMKAEETRSAIRRGEIHAAKLAASSR
ncbi:unnamed protein product [Cladocopium goreaui]|uniref:Uncharacterized protein n=1 Tax=Cladocopium goreaui TaxID=2562237 RepID=A0A9P1FR48_9DINO|nr:unnamed protein product [Cladocopium goreaui]